MKAIILSAALAVSLAAPAWANRCGPSVAVIQLLTERYGEEVVEMAKRPSREDEPVELTYHLWVNKQTGSWTATVTWPNGLTCIGPSGRDLGQRTLTDFLHPAGVPV